MGEQTNVGSNEEEPSQLLPYHGHGKEDEDDDTKGNGKDMTFLDADSVHGCFFNNGIFSGHHSALLEYNPYQGDG